MSQLPFSVYDFFAYLAAGFIVLAAADYAFDGRWLLQNELTLVVGAFWVVAAYILGHIIANLAGHILQRWIVRSWLSSSEDVLFWENESKGFRRLFPGYHERLPAATRTRILTKAKRLAAEIEEPGRALFYHCFERVKHDEATRERLNSFLNMYGFSRNASLALLLSALILIVGLITDDRRSGGTGDYAAWASLAAALAGIGMFYRYLKFYREYTLEVFRSYAEKEEAGDK
jgi:hypothetical protein